METGPCYTGFDPYGFERKSFRMIGMDKILIAAGVFLIVSGLVFIFWSSVPVLGKLPGNLNFSIGGVRIFFPLLASIVISLLLTAILNIFIHFTK